MDTVTPASGSPSRRTLIVGALGGFVAWAASAIGRPSRLQATNGDAITVGGTLTGTSATWLTNTNSGGDAFHAYALGSGTAVFGISGTSIGVKGQSGSTTGVYGVSGAEYGVRGHSDSGYGVFGDTSTGTGVVGSSTANAGVYGVSASSGFAAVIGRSDGNGTAVEGYSGTGPAPAGPAKTGVYGYAVQDSSSKGVWGRTTSGHAIHGTATSGFAGYFAGKVYTSSFHEMSEISAPSAPGANKGRIFMRDAGGKTQLCVRLNIGAIQVLSTQP